MSRVYWQFQNKPKLAAWMAMVGRQFDDLEQAFQSLLTLLNIDASNGAQLDNLGRVVGQPRQGVDDITYRLYLRARIKASHSSGTGEDIYVVIGALFGLPMVLVNSPVKTFALTIIGAITRTQALVAASFLTDAKEAGARGILIWQEAPAAAMFTFDTGPGLDVGLFAGAVSV